MNSINTDKKVRSYSRSILPIIIILCSISMVSCTLENVIYVSDKVQNPVSTPLGSIFNEEQVIQLTCGTAGATIVYTTDGSNPSRTNGNQYTSRFLVNIFSIVKFFAYKSDLNDSDIVRSAYSFKVSGLNYLWNFNSLTSDTIFSSDATIKIENSTPGSTIFYTVDGSLPSSSSPMYITPLTLSAPVTIRSIAYKYGWSYSESKSIKFDFKAEPPSIYPNGGEFFSPLSVVLSPSIYGSQIYYTLDGSTPNATSTLYNGPLNISSTTTVKAMAVKSGMQDSEVAITKYVFKTSSPRFTPATGVYKENQMVSLNSDSGSVIYYTINDLVAPPNTGSTLYTGPFLVTHGDTVKAIAYKPGFEDSLVVSESYSVDGNLTKLSPPLVDNLPGLYTNTVTLSLSSSDSAGIKYTLDGTTPSLTNGHPYEYPITLEKSTTLNALCVKDSFATSDLATFSYTIEGQVLAPVVLSLTDGQIFNGAAKLEIENPTYESVVRYTINGNDPTENDSVYTGPVSLVSGLKQLSIKVKAFKPGWTPSEVVSCGITFKLPLPTFNPQEGTFKKVVNLILSQPVLGATTRYTLDGTIPTPSVGTIYSGEIIIMNTDSTIKVLSYKDGWENSEVAQAVYTLTP